MAIARKIHKVRYWLRNPSFFVESIYFFTSEKRYIISVAICLLRSAYTFSCSGVPSDFLGSSYFTENIASASRIKGQWVSASEQVIKATKGVGLKGSL